MVEKIQEKKAALGSSGSEEAGVLSPFTPQNSYVDTDFPSACAKETQLPSFHSSDMVERIRVKRSSMERDLQGGEEGSEFDTALLNDGQSPFTPHNSYVEGSLEKYATETLPSLNNAEIANKIKQKQAELTEAAGQPPSGTDSPPGLVISADSPGAPYTPQNSYRESHLEALSFDSHLADLNEVAERLSLTGSESSGSLNEPKAIRASNRVHQQGISPQEAKGFFVSEMGESADPPSLSGLSDEGRSGSPEDSGAKRKGALFSQLQDDEAARDVTEKAIQRIAYELANEMIQKALETFPSGSVKELVPSEGAAGKTVSHPSISEDSSPTMDESDQELSHPLSPTGQLSPEKPDSSPERDLTGSALVSSSDSERFAAEFSHPAEASMKTSSSLADELAQALDKGRAEGFGNFPQQRLSLLESSIPRSESYEIETEYLSDMDPLHCVHSPDANIIETDANKEVVEGASFRKISGQEYQTVQVQDGVCVCVCVCVCLYLCM